MKAAPHWPALQPLVDQLVADGMHQQTIAEAIGVSPASITRIKAGSTLTAEPLIRLIKLAGYQVEAYFDGRLEPASSSPAPVLSFADAEAALPAGRYSAETVNAAKRVLSVLVPRSVSLALLDHACALVVLAASAPERSTEPRTETRVNAAARALRAEHEGEQAPGSRKRASR